MGASACIDVKCVEFRFAAAMYIPPSHDEKDSQRVENHGYYSKTF